MFASQFLMNNIALIFGTIAKAVNKKASGYGLYLTTVARDGGLREDSIALIACMIHSRTSQKYEKKVLTAGWNDALLDGLEKEKAHFEKIKEAEDNVNILSQIDCSDTDLKAAIGELEHLLDITPAQFQIVWDNLNLTTKHRFERAEDKDSTSRLDWMASIWILDRINANHMDNTKGSSVKRVEDLSIKDMIASDKEKDYIFINLVSYFAHRLIKRHPHIYKSISTCIKPNRPHQFQAAMDQKSEEITGKQKKHKIG